MARRGEQEGEYSWLTWLGGLGDSEDSSGVRGSLKVKPGQPVGGDSPFKPKGQGSPRSSAGPQPLRPHLSSPTPHSLVAEDFAVVEDLNLEYLIVVDAAGHRPPEGLGRERHSCGLGWKRQTGV